MLENQEEVLNSQEEVQEQPAAENKAPEQNVDSPVSQDDEGTIKVDFTKMNLSRNDLMNKLRKIGIITQVHYIPIPLHPYYGNRHKPTPWQSKNEGANDGHPADRI